MNRMRPNRLPASPPPLPPRVEEGWGRGACRRLGFLVQSGRRQFASTSAAPAAAGAAQAGPAAGGGGGHTLATILTLVGTAVSVGGAIYYMKVLKKATSQVPSN